MATSIRTAEIIAPSEKLGDYAVREPALVQYDAQVWSCAEQRQIAARLYYSVSQEYPGRACYRLLFIEPLNSPSRIN